MSSRWFELSADSLVLHLKVQPRSPREGVDDVLGGRLRLRLNAPPVDDKANQALVAWLAREFGVPKSAVEIVLGGHSRLKSVRLPPPARWPAWFAALGGAA